MVPNNWITSIPRHSMPASSKLDKSRTYYIYCRSGKRSHGACLKMQKQGFKVYDMEGGILNWTKLGMPVER